MVVWGGFQGAFRLSGSKENFFLIFFFGELFFLARVCHICHLVTVGISTTTRRTLARETSASRHHWEPVNVFLKSPCITAIWYWGVWGPPLWREYTLFIILYGKENVPSLEAAVIFHTPIDRFFHSILIFHAYLLFVKKTQGDCLNASPLPSHPSPFSSPPSPCTGNLSVINAFVKYIRDPEDPYPNIGMYIYIYIIII